MCATAHVFIEKMNTSLVKERRLIKIIEISENREKEETEIERIQDYKKHKKGVFMRQRKL